MAPTEVSHTQTQSAGTQENNASPNKGTSGTTTQNDCHSTPRPNPLHSVPEGTANTKQPLKVSFQEVDNETFEVPSMSEEEKEAQMITEAAAKLNITEKDVIIAVMGLTGVGKSTFIKYLSQDEIIIGHTLDSCTVNVGVHPFTYKDGRTIYLVDTPGFDDQKRTDTEILKEVSDFLAATYSISIKLAGIIYLHRASDNRMGHSAFRNLSMFQKLCGKACFPKVVLATTMWDRLTDVNIGLRAEKQLMETQDFWGDMIDEGSKVFRQNSGAQSASEIVDYIMNLEGNGAVMAIQHERVDEHLLLKHTAAGKDVAKDLIEQEKAHAKELETVRESLQAAIDSGNKKHEQKFAVMEATLKAEAAQLQVDKTTLEGKYEAIDTKFKTEIEDLKRQRTGHEAAIKVAKDEITKIKNEQTARQVKFNAKQKKNETEWKAQIAKDKIDSDRRQTDLQKKIDALEQKQPRRSTGKAIATAIGGGATALVGVFTLQPVLIAAGGAMMVGGAASANRDS